MPDGFSCTGFKIEGYSNNYVILLREFTDRADFDIEIKEILATNDETAKPGRVKINKRFGYVFGIL